MEEANIQRFFPVLRSVYGGLTKSERRIADYIANHIGVVMEQTVADLAAQTESSEITISRFCKKLGCSGLKELKLMLAAGMSAAPPKAFHDIDAGDGGRDVASKVFANISEGLQDTLSLLDYEALDAAAAMIFSGQKSLCLWLWQLGHGLYRYGDPFFAPGSGHPSRCRFPYAGYRSGPSDA